MPLGAFISDKRIMDKLTENPVLGHITTFGGHPVSCAAGMASMKILLEEKIIDGIGTKEKLFNSLLVHPKIKSVRSFGLWMALGFDSFETNKKVIDACLDSTIVPPIMTDWFLFAPQCLRISPPLVISDSEINIACQKILSAIRSI